MILIDLIKYFAKFPDTAGVLKILSRTTSKVSGYTELDAYLRSLGTPVIPGIKNYLVSTDENVISSQIRNMGSYFLMLEYSGLFSSPPNRAYVRESAFNLSVIVAHPNNKPGFDLAEEQLVSAQCLDYTVQIAKQMETDNKELCSNRRFMPGSVNISPVEPAMLYGCIGWAITFTKSEPLFNE
jgi:hypothetical protein